MVSLESASRRQAAPIVNKVLAEKDWPVAVAHGIRLARAFPADLGPET